MLKFSQNIIIAQISQFIKLNLKIVKLSILPTKPKYNES